MLVQYTECLNHDKILCLIPFNPVADFHLFLLYVSVACFIVNLMTNLKSAYGTVLEMRLLAN